MITIDKEAQKPLQCSECESQDIANMVNEGKLRCLNCGREKANPNSLQEAIRREMGSSANTVWVPKENPRPYRSF